ncbi:hypothetical protein KEM60_00451 [Austwickia sp. TVS 96-490-7B]|uniref:hypothetical protein n=1 Tax=Austwickia sp. TVS 96-490-7B TaxID=2830843 RepID=UPI001C586705|nr:hypothetical protein [Austwickia sp. TVS 96-490-7B]MBW3084264.1 hypothetical protein [Austwickia sp. TVS 96-490-7B]
MRDIEVRLRGHGGPDAELRADRVAAIAAALDDLVLRLTREAASAAGLGRPGFAIERLGEVRLISIAAGGPRLTFTVGDADALDIDPLGQMTDALFWGIVEGMAVNERPTFVTNTIAEATMRFVAALQRSAPHVDVTFGARSPIHLATGAINRRVWEPDDSGAHRRTLTGLLEAVDLRNAHFRIVDAEDNRVELVDVREAEEASQLVGQVVVAEGTFIPARGASKPRMEEVAVRAAVPISMSPEMSPDGVGSRQGDSTSAEPDVESWGGLFSHVTR